MAERTPTAARLTRQAVAAARDGEVADARNLLAEALAVNDRYPPAWLWFASLAADDGERRFCLERAVAAGDEGSASRLLAGLRKVSPSVPPELEDIVDPPLPDSLVGPPPRRRKWLAGWRLAALIGLAGLTAALLAFAVVGLGKGERKVYIAFAGPVSGPTAAAGAQAMLNSVRLELERVNEDGGIDGRRVELLVFDDGDDPDRAREAAEQMVADGRPLAVIGHFSSGASLAAGRVYAAARLPAITATATADSLTDGNPWYFRAIFSNSNQGARLAAYTLQVLEANAVSIVAEDQEYGSTLAAAFRGAFSREGTIRKDLELAVGDATATEIDRVAGELQDQPEEQPILLAMQDLEATPLIVALRRLGVESQIIGGDSLGTDAFVSSFAAIPGAEGYGEGIVASSPVILDSLTGEAVRWLFDYMDAYGSSPSWEGATAREAVILLTHALSEIDLDSDDGDAARTALRDELAAIDAPERAVRGLTAPLFFDETRSIPEPISFGIGREGLFVSAPQQLRLLAAGTGVDPQVEVAEGRAVEFGGEVLAMQRVVTVGVNINELRELDTDSSTFFADFFVWLRYFGDDQVPSDLEFVNAVDPGLSLGTPLRTSTAAGITYSLYRVSSQFRADLAFRDFPFDDQHLEVVIQNRNAPSSQIVYSLDPVLRLVSQEERLTSGLNVEASVDAIPNWRAAELRYRQAATGNTSSLGDPLALEGESGIAYSQFVTDVRIDRDLRGFLIKNLLPLALLAAVTYCSLFFPFSQTGARVSFAVTGILTGAVLLTQVTSALPDVGYTVAIEWAYYAFIVLCALCVLVGIVGDHLYEQRDVATIRRLNLAARTVYPLLIAAVVAFYFVRYT